MPLEDTNECILGPNWKPKCDYAKILWQQSEKLFGSGKTSDMFDAEAWIEAVAIGLARSPVPWRLDNTLPVHLFQNTTAISHLKTLKSL